MVFAAADMGDKNADAGACFARSQESVALRLYGNYRCDTKFIAKKKKNVHERPFVYTKGKRYSVRPTLTF